MDLPLRAVRQLSPPWFHLSEADRFRKPGMGLSAKWSHSQGNGVETLTSGDDDIVLLEQLWGSHIVQESGSCMYLGLHWH